MAFKMVLDSLEGLPDDVAKEYVEKDGKYVIQVEGMKPPEEFTKIQNSLNAARTEANGLKQRLGLLGDRKIEDVIPLLDRIPELEAAAEGKLDDDAINNIVEGRIKSKLAPVERERDQLRQQVGERDQTITQFQQKDRDRQIRRQIRSAAKESGMREEAVEDALLLGERSFELLEDGQAVVREGSGFNQGLGPKDWLGDLQSKRPHWWPESEGGGAGGNRSGGGSFANNPFTAEHWNLTEQGKIVRSDSARADQLAKAAGTTVGGGKPALKK